MDIDASLNDPIQQVFGESTPTTANEVETPSVETQVETPANDTPWWKTDEFQGKTLEYRSSNKDVSEDIETVLKRASMGYNYAQNMQQLNQEKEAFQSEMERERQRVSDMENKWKQYDDFAKQNPEWANHVNSAWENRFSNTSQETGTQSPPQATNIPEEYQKKIEAFENFMGDFKRSQEDQALNTEIEKVRSEYQDIDFSYSDPNSGKTLEMQVLEHARNNGISNFRAAFRDFYHDALVRKSVEQAKKDLGSKIQANAKQGIISNSETPIAQKSPQSYQIQSMDDAFSAAAQSLGIDF